MRWNKIRLVAVSISKYIVVGGIGLFLRIFLLQIKDMGSFMLIHRGDMIIADAGELVRSIIQQ